MNIKEDIRPISFVKSHAAEILNQVNETHRPIYVTQNGEVKAVLLDPESFENMKNAIGILKLLSLGENDIINKRYRSHDEVMSRLEKKLLSKKKNNAKNTNFKQIEENTIVRVYYDYSDALNHTIEGRIIFNNEVKNYTFKSSFDGSYVGIG